jgi:small subunit ribosomal protein S8e
VTDNTKRKLAERRKERIPLSQSIVDQFAAGRLYASITSRPGQCGRCDGYILEGEELNFYLRKMQKKKGKAQQ